MIKCKFRPEDQETELRHLTVAAIIVRAGKVLLSKRGYYKGHPIGEFGKWTLAGGYLDKDETSVQGLEREAMEEVGCKLTNIKLLRIVDAPIRPNENKQNVTFVFVADFVSQIEFENEEVLEQKWFDLDDLPPQAMIAFDHYDDLMLYKELVSGTYKAESWQRLPAEVFTV